MWHVHGAWTTAFVQGDHEYLVPVDDERGPDGRGRAETYEWPANAIELTREEGPDADVDVVVLQRPHELEHLAAEWLGGRVPGRDIPAVYVEHNTPQGRINEMRHPAADRDDLTLAHVTWFNRLFWDAGSTRTTVIEHGVIDPGELYTGELPRAAAVINEAKRRARVTGTDLLEPLSAGAPIDVFGIDAGSVGGIADLPQAELHQEMGRRRLYLHPLRWTSLGLALIEAMQMGMPVVALATTEAAEVVPREAGVISNRPETLIAGMERFVADPALAREAGNAGRRFATERFGIDRFVDDWNQLLTEVAG